MSDWQPGRDATVGVFSQRATRFPALASLLGARTVVTRPGANDVGRLDAVADWGHAPEAWEARRFARRHGLPYLRLGDGFFQSVSPPGGPFNVRPLSLVVDDVGIHYDGTQTSRLEQWLNDGHAGEPLMDDALLARAAALTRRIRSEGLSRFNDGATRLPASLTVSRPRALVVDQRRGAVEVELGRAHPGSFLRMLEAALDEHPDAEILLLRPRATPGQPAVGHLPPTLPSRVSVVPANVTPALLFGLVDDVYVATSTLGLEALLFGKRVRCFGAPFFAGWGLTHDDLSHPRRTRQRSLDALVAAALFRYSRYVDPFEESVTTPERVAEHLALQRRRFQENARTYHCVGFNRWKRPFVRRFLASPDGDVRFLWTARELAREPTTSDSVVLVWGMRDGDDLRQVADRRDLPVWRMEDGFLRSVGLGTDFTSPASLVVDRQGIYFDPSRASDLEHILADLDATRDELDRAAVLRKSILKMRLSKYNAGRREALKLDGVGGRRVVFVPGQVPGDASVLLGSQTVRDDRCLLAAVRSARPDAFILYKPHPDVVTGNRQGVVVDTDAYDAQVVDVSIADCLDVAEEVHTMTSLVGFEALLREKRVVCWGQPFYSGWGLTQDEAPLRRRRRSLSLDELVVGTLLRYPRYHALDGSAFCSALDTVRELDQLRRQSDVGLTSRRPPLARVALNQWNRLKRVLGRG